MEFRFVKSVEFSAQYGGPLAYFFAEMHVTENDFSFRKLILCFFMPKCREGG